MNEQQIKELTDLAQKSQSLTEEMIATGFWAAVDLAAFHGIQVLLILGAIGWFRRGLGKNKWEIEVVDTGEYNG